MSEILLGMSSLLETAKRLTVFHVCTDEARHKHVHLERINVKAPRQRLDVLLIFVRRHGSALPMNERHAGCHLPHNRYKVKRQRLSSEIFVGLAIVS